MQCNATARQGATETGAEKYKKYKIKGKGIRGAKS